MRLAAAKFQRLTNKAFLEIPKAFRDILVNLKIQVRASPGKEAGRWKGSKSLLGLYSGLDRADMLSPYAGSHEPARIFLYQRNIEAGARDEKELAESIRTTLRHEFAHHFGFSDKDLREKWPEGA